VLRSDWYINELQKELETVSGTRRIESRRTSCANTNAAYPRFKPERVFRAYVLHECHDTFFTRIGSAQVARRRSKRSIFRDIHRIESRKVVHARNPPGSQEFRALGMVFRVRIRFIAAYTTVARSAHVLLYCARLNSWKRSATFLDIRRDLFFFFGQLLLLIFRCKIVRIRRDLDGTG
jgi:hypothetical protein